MSIPDAIILAYTATVFLGIVAIVAVALVLLRVARLYAPDPNSDRPVPAFGQRPTTDPGAFLDNEEPTVSGENGWPEGKPGNPSKVAGQEVVTHVLGAADGHSRGEREKWFEEKRDEGLEDEEILALEASQVVPLFESE